MEAIRCNVQSTFLSKRLPFPDFQRPNSCYYSRLKICESRPKRCGFGMSYGGLRVRAMDDDSFADFTLEGWSDSSRPVEYIVSSSEGEDSDGEIILHPISDIDLPTTRERLLSADDSLTVTAHRLVTLGRASDKKSTSYGVMNSVGLALISTIILLVVDHFAWRIVRMPLAPFYLMRPFVTALALVPCFGYICLPLFRVLNFGLAISKGVPLYSSTKAKFSMDGVFFIPIGILVAEAAVKFSSTEVFGAAATTILLASIGVLANYFGIIKKIKRLPAWIRCFIEVSAGAWFSYWMYTTDISTPYNMKMVVPLPPPVGLVCARKFYPILTSICFVSTINGVGLTNGLSGMAPGTAALVFIGMSIVIVPICSDLSIFGASMAGACIGYLLYSHRNTCESIGHTGSLALGGALAAMASCTGMFFPLLICSGVFVVETLSVITQASWFKATRFIHGKGHKLLRTAPLHEHLVMSGIQQQKIVAAAYFFSSLLIVCASYVGLSSL